MNDAYVGTLSSYAYVLMCISHLQVRLACTHIDRFSAYTSMLAAHMLSCSMGSTHGVATMQRILQIAVHVARALHVAHACSFYSCMPKST